MKQSNGYRLIIPGDTVEDNTMFREGVKRKKGRGVGRGGKEQDT